MIKTLPKRVYTQMNTVEDAYLIQNHSGYALLIVVAASKPSDSTDYDLKLEPGEAIGNHHSVGTCWGKPAGSVDISVGIVE